MNIYQIPMGKFYFNKIVLWKFCRWKVEDFAPKFPFGQKNLRFKKPVNVNEN